MRHATTARAAVVALLFLTLPAAAMADTVHIPAGTTIYCVLDESLSTKKRSSHYVQQGDRVRATVAEDVLVDGHVVIEAGTNVWSEVRRARRAKVAGIRGRLEVEANTVTAVDDTTIRLAGGYDRSGKGRFVLTAALTAAVAWPFIFIKGKHARLERGVIFDAQTAAPIDVEVEARPELPVLRADIPRFQVSIPYDRIDPDVRLARLPLHFDGLPADTEEAHVTAVNGEKIRRLEIAIVNGTGEVDFQELAEHFRLGLNRFTVMVDGQSVDVLLEFEF